MKSKKKKYYIVWGMLVYKMHAMRTYTNATARIKEARAPKWPKKRRK